MVESKMMENAAYFMKACVEIDFCIFVYLILINNKLLYKCPSFLVLFILLFLLHRPPANMAGDAI